jgi:hypothetical protein
MIPITIDGEQFALSFSHSKFDPSTEKKVVYKRVNGEVASVEVVDYVPRRRRDSECRIVRLVKTAGDDVITYELVARGKASCSPEDNFCKETGRVKALADALRRAKKSSDPLFGVHDEASSKRFQAVEDQVWGQYMNRASIRSHYKEIAA